MPNGAAFSFIFFSLADIAARWTIDACGHDIFHSAEQRPHTGQQGSLRNTPPLHSST